MNIVPSRKSVILRPFLKRVNATANQERPPSVDMSRVGYLYIAAALFQAVWLYILFLNFEVAREWVRLPFFGWALALIWSAMVWVVIHLPYLGIQMIRQSRNPNTTIVQSEYQKQKLGQVILLLVLGMLLDVLIFSLLLPNIEDKEFVILLSGMMGGRIVQANAEAIFQYYGI